MTRSFYDILAFAALLFWPAIPLFWIPVHCVPGLFRRLGFLTYVLPLITWLPIAYIMFGLRDVLLRHRIELPAMTNLFGLLLFVLGAGLQTWTLVLLTLPVIIGMPEVTKSVSGKLVTTGPFGIVRHPTYLSHTLMLLGLFLMTGVTALGIVTVVDAIVVNGIVMPLEEKELLNRFGKEYEEYRHKVSSRFLPPLRSR
ncbi:MAG TPA: isoprenylcysteine carboxylmethyltransferase family protein [Nitrospirota bacterium]|nr:isoprenylcysteine carboxylmethyltransferase family protein [Nitrospirota bacterium]